MARGAGAAGGGDRGEAAQAATGGRVAEAVVAADRGLVDRQRGVLGVGERAAERLSGGQPGLPGVTLFPYTTLFRSLEAAGAGADRVAGGARADDAGQIPTRGA